MNPAPAPIACDLSRLTTAQRRREQELLAAIRARLGERRETESGFRFGLPDEPESLGMLGEFIALERRCCPFLRFELVVPGTATAAEVHLFGGRGVKEFLAHLLPA